MTIFRLIMLVLFISITGYTAVTISNHGWNLVPVFFGDMAAMAWPGQFNFDFMGFLILSALWIAWRYEFSGPGLLLTPLALTGGILFLSFYLLVISFTEGGDVKSILLGKRAQN